MPRFEFDIFGDSTHYKLYMANSMTAIIFLIPLLGSFCNKVALIYDDYDLKIY